MPEKRTISAEDYQLLLESIESAQGPGACKYTAREGDKLVPCCVIGQFAARKGVDLEKLEEFDEAKTLIGVIYDSFPELHSVRQETLNTLQIHWDSARPERVHVARQAMRRCLEWEAA